MNMNKKEIEEQQDQIKELKELIEETEEEIKNYQDIDSDTGEEYKEYLDETHDIINIGGITLNPSDVLKECDPIAFKCGFNDWADEFINNLNDELEELKSKLEDAEADLKDLKGV